MPSLDLSWHQHAACRGMDLNLFFPVGDSKAFQPLIEEAKAICAGCPVKEQCLNFARCSHEKYGTYGGETEWEREASRRNWLRHTPPERRGAA